MVQTLEHPIVRRLVTGFGLFALLACSGGNRPPSADGCSPNPCNETNKTLCVVEEGNARCLCNAGFVSRPSGACEEITASNCPEHTGDSEEPDDCLVRARAIESTSEARTRSIDPAGDYDFFRVEGSLDEVYVANVQAQGALYPRLDVYDQGGLHLGAAESIKSTRLAFKALATAPYFLRVSHSPIDPSVGTGDYTLTVSRAGKDDYGDDVARATAIAPDVSGTASPRLFEGRFEYPNDTDWFSFSATTTSRYVIQFDESKTIPTVVFYASSEATTPLFVTTQANLEFYASQAGTAYLALYPSEGEGSWAFSFLRD